MSKLDIQGEIDLSVPLDFASEIASICEPLRSQLEVIFFEHICSLDNGSSYRLTSNTKWLERLYSGYFFNKVSFENIPQYHQNQIIVWRAIPDEGSRQLLVEAADYGISNGITIVQRTKRCCNFYNFGARSDSAGAENIFLNEMRLLKKFILFYNSDAQKIIEIAKKRPVFIPSKKNNILLLADKHYDYASNKNIDENLYFKKGVRFDNNKISRREIECLQWLELGKSTEEIGLILNISKRTVEKYLERIKHKLGCYKNTALIRKALDIGLI